ncbi:MAG: flagellar basal body-associated FliL family protein, partial [Thioalkalispiraceae bacterium]|jgi:flagellar FliL protein
MIIALVVLLTTGATIGALYFTGSLGNISSEQAKPEAADADDTAEEVAAKPAFYYELQPAFVVNFEDQSQAAYLQVEMQLMTYDKAVHKQITKHMPVIRNNILLILSAQKYQQVRTRQGKEALQSEILKAVREIAGPAMKEQLQQDAETEIQDQDVPNVEQVYFTSFIMQ